MCQSDGYRRIVRGENPTNAAVVGKKKNLQEKLWFIQIAWVSVEKAIMVQADLSLGKRCARQSVLHAILLFVCHHPTSL